MLDQARIDTLAAQDVRPGAHIIDGERRGASDGGEMDVISPLNGKVLTTIPRGTRVDAERAIASARRAFEDGRWAELPPAARKRTLLKWADLIEANALELAVLGVRDNGTEIGMAFKAEPLSAVATIRYYAEAIDKLYGEIAPTDPSVLALVHRAPVGVVGAIVPWNFPLMIGAWKVAPALAAGNSVVLKPAETASLTLLRIAELALEAGIPPGVFNVVTGEGAVVGEAMGLSMDVDVLVFTGSGPVGRRLLEYSAKSNLKRVYLELGGKSPNIVFADAPDLTEAVKVSANGIFRNAGQVCVAGSRLLVERAIHDEFVSKLAEFVKTMSVGNPLDLSTSAGAVNSLRQLDQNLRFVDEARSAGRVVIGGARILEETGGYFMEPTIVTGVDPSDPIAQNEVFGPVVAVIPFDSEGEAVRIANGTDYGLAAAVWTRDLSRAHRMIRAIRAGVVHVNTYGGPDVTVPIGGVKQSGNGHDKSLHAFDKYLDLKTAWIKL
ncbi:gamma-glutamyl-gamma-aminobutyraldehyde dehydrogenase [Maritimibacter alkaliphilus HTCC2654]|uniref:Aldehyde dehydrogenase family protein n=1 Tax=Maritimibacter alkaliphilus HTCC2654 TaxID=314271 RepID=A3VCB8_9RHOB|nr:aldehyde dehydrogenase [Maritimibacter alkaliphilus]EAQ14009.1 aldehyde dehydrogenase family protein [Maritimibacter alkaliphilus HTCC2654]TYP84205.1 gamma-glutamyl-gamma-aminobutyraldehyde dehydrogenase [Maritimibacter alkaliphilus HTCC2654]